MRAGRARLLALASTRLGRGTSLRANWRGPIGSVDGGFELFRELRANSASKRVTRSRSDAFSVASRSISPRSSSFNARAVASCSRNEIAGTPKVYQPSRAEWWILALSARKDLNVYIPA